MSAEKLREAAAVLRERAGNATPGAWTNAHLGHVVDMAVPRPATGAPFAVCHGDGFAPNTANATYIAMMHPGVGLALAGWFDEEAQRAVYRERQRDATNKVLMPRLEPYPAYYDPSTVKAIAVALLLLGEQP